MFPCPKKIYAFKDRRRAQAKRTDVESGDIFNGAEFCAAQSKSCSMPQPAWPLRALKGRLYPARYYRTAGAKIEKTRRSPRMFGRVDQLADYSGLAGTDATAFMSVLGRGGRLPRYRFSALSVEGKGRPGSRRSVDGVSCVLFDLANCVRYYY